MSEADPDPDPDADESTEERARDLIDEVRTRIYEYRANHYDDTGMVVYINPDDHSLLNYYAGKLVSGAHISGPGSESGATEVIGVDTFVDPLVGAGEPVVTQRYREDLPVDEMFTDSPTAAHLLPLIQSETEIHYGEPDETGIPLVLRTRIMFELLRDRFDPVDLPDGFRIDSDDRDRAMNAGSTYDERSKFSLVSFTQHSYVSRDALDLGLGPDVDEYHETTEATGPDSFRVGIERAQIPGGRPIRARLEQAKEGLTETIADAVGSTREETIYAKRRREVPRKNYDLTPAVRRVENEYERRKAGTYYQSLGRVFLKPYSVIEAGANSELL